jgi:hypothetical protein
MFHIVIYYDNRKLHTVKITEFSAIIVLCELRVENRNLRLFKNTYRGERGTNVTPGYHTLTRTGAYHLYALPGRY